jgi:extracellular factor (EF) 3-hydroxypalmitic acid methyl ester biosynthesis protein
MAKDESEYPASLVVCHASAGVELRGSLLRVTRYSVVFEVYNPHCVLRLSEVLSEFQIVVRDRTVYSGRAVVGNLLNAGLALVCEAVLEEASWQDVDLASAMSGSGSLREQFAAFLTDWQKLYRIGAEYKLVIADMQNFFMDLRLWLDQVELGIRSVPSGDRLKLERRIADEIAEPVVPAINVLFEKFEHLALGLEEEVRPAHRSYMRRQLHPLVMCAPFPARAFYKPLGYAGDYEMVNMMARNTPEGSSLFAKVVNAWFLRQPPAEAHRNRIRYLSERIFQETTRVVAAGRSARIFNIACGPAHEVQQFLVDQAVSARANFTLLDFNEETLQYVKNSLDQTQARHGRQTAVQYVKKSVHQMLKESSRTIEGPGRHQYDLVYCAGLFDYLSDQVCLRLMNTMYDSLAPGGLLISTNVEPGNPLRYGMEHLLDWHLIYRTAPQMLLLRPQQAPADSAAVLCDETGVNVFLEVRKPTCS